MPSILEIKKTIGGLNRLQDILSVFFEQGFGFLIERLRLRYLIPFRYRVNRFLKRHPSGSFAVKKPIDPAERLRIAFEKLGPSFIKLGQILSLRPDVIPESYCRELEKLQSQAPAFSFREVEKTISDELKKPIEEIFSSFEKKPFAAASLAQVHKAVLKTGEVVAVKIQRPDIKPVIENDIHILFFIAHLFKKYIPESRNYRPVKLVKEFASWVLRELDFTVEATNADHFRAILKDYPTVKIPEIYWDYSSKRVLVMEFIDGVKVDDLAALKKKEIDPRKIAETGLDIALKQLFVDGFFQADPHPGNFFALPGNILCLYDFGMVGYLTPEVRSELTAIFMAMMDRNVEGVLKHLTHLAEIDEDSELKLFRDSVFDILTRQFYGLGRRESAAAVFYRIVNVGAKYGVIFPSDLVYFGKALVTTEAMGVKLWPDADFDAALQPFIGRLIGNQLAPGRIYSELRSDFFDFARFLKNLPEHTLKLMDKLEKGDIGVRINPKEFLEIKREIDRQNDIKVLALIAAALIIGSAVILRLERVATVWGFPLGYIGFALSLFLVFWVIIKVKEN